MDSYPPLFCQSNLRLNRGTLQPRLPGSQRHLWKTFIQSPRCQLIPNPKCASPRSTIEWLENQSTATGSLRSPPGKRTPEWGRGRTVKRVRFHGHGTSCGRPLLVWPHILRDIESSRCANILINQIELDPLVAKCYSRIACSIRSSSQNTDLDASSCHFGAGR